MKLATMTMIVGMTLASPVMAQMAGPTTDLSKVEGGVFNIDKNHARMIFSYSHFGYSISYGLFTDFSGKLNFDPKAPAAGSLEVAVNLDGIETTVPKLNEHLKGADFFNVAKFPSATFKSTAVAVTGPTTGTVTGDLTLKGVTKPVTLQVVFNGGGVNMQKAYDLGFNAVGQIKRSDFGLGAYVPAVGDDVTLTISTEFDRVQ